MKHPIHMFFQSSVFGSMTVSSSSFSSSSCLMGVGGGVCGGVGGGVGSGGAGSRRKRIFLMRFDLVLVRVTRTTFQCRGPFFHVSVSLGRLTLESVEEVEVTPAEGVLVAV